MKDLFIRSIGYYVPEGRLSNDDVLARVRAANEKKMAAAELDLLLYGDLRKFEFLGIESRSIGLDPEQDSCVGMGYRAASRAIEAAGLTPEAIDCVIGCGVSNPFMEPSLALVIAHTLGVESGDFFDVNDTCNGFMKGMDIAGLYLRSGRCRNALVVTSENPYELADGLGIDYSLPGASDADKRFASLLAGCGAAAVVLSTEGSGKRIADYIEKRESNNWCASILTVPGIVLSESRPRRVSPGLWTDARLVSAQVIKDLPDFIKESIALWGKSLDDFNLVVLHQLGNNVTFATIDRLCLAREKAPINTFHEFGNMASANIPINLARAFERGMLHDGDSVLLAGSACGLSYSLMHVEW